MEMFLEMIMKLWTYKTFIEKQWNNHEGNGTFYFIFQFCDVTNVVCYHISAYNYCQIHMTHINQIT